MSTPEAVHRLLAAFPDLRDRPVVAIPNGYAAEDFAAPLPARDDGAFRIVHTGYLHTELGLQHRRSLPLRRFLRGSVPGLDILEAKNACVDGLGVEGRVPAEERESLVGRVVSDGDFDGERSVG